MALTRTSIAADCTADATTLSITSTSSGFPTVGVIVGNGQLACLDGEYLLITQVPVAGTVKVAQRGYNGTVARAHDVLAPFTTGSAADFAEIGAGFDDARPPNVDEILSIGENGIIPVPVKNTTYELTKGSALASTTLAAPGKDQDGLRIVFTSATAYAHVLTATTLWGDGASGSPHTTATFAAYVGASLTVEAINGIWNVVASVGVTIT